MLARWTLPALRSLPKRARWACFHTKSVTTDDPRVSRLEMYAENGQYRFDMNIYNYGKRNNDSPLIIYLPGMTPEIGLDNQDQTCLDLGIPESLAEKFRVVRVNYRWSPKVPFPAPIHDIVTAYDAITSTFCTPKTKIGVYGRYLGGTLATSLALTESKQRSPNSISALAASNAILDWTQIPLNEVLLADFSDLKEIEDARKRTFVAENLKADAAVLRKSLFSIPASCFDPFASPILFFRNAGRDVPEEFTDDFMPLIPESSTSSSPSSEEMSILDFEPSRPTAARKSHMRFPPKGSNLVIPKTRITTSCGGFREGHGRELVKLMRRSVVMYEMKDARDFDVDADEEAESRVQFINEAGWKEGFKGVDIKTVEWLEDVLDP